MKEDWQEAIWICALRYALGRRTYITGIVSEFIMQQKLSKKTKSVMIRDIQECDDLGMECDKREWIKLLNYLKK